MKYILPRFRAGSPGKRHSHSVAPRPRCALRGVRAGCWSANAAPIPYRTLPLACLYYHATVLSSEAHSPAAICPACPRFHVSRACASGDTRGDKGVDLRRDGVVVVEARLLLGRDARGANLGRRRSRDEVRREGEPPRGEFRASLGVAAGRLPLFPCRPPAPDLRAHQSAED